MLSVPAAAEVVRRLGLEFVHYVEVSTDLQDLNAERDAPSEQARRNLVQGDQTREGVVLRPLIEFKKPDGSRVIAKHKRDDFRETSTPREVDPEKLKILTDATAIANEWVTPMRLEHVLDKIEKPHVIMQTRMVIDAMIEDVFREGKGELVEGPEVGKAIATKTSKMFKKWLEKIDG